MSDLVLGLVIGIVLVVFMNPFKGVFWIFREYKSQIAFLTRGRQTLEETYEEAEHGPGPARTKEKET